MIGLANNPASQHLLLGQSRREDRQCLMAGTTHRAIRDPVRDDTKSPERTGDLLDRDTLSFELVPNFVNHASGTVRVLPCGGSQTE